MAASGTKKYLVSVAGSKESMATVDYIADMMYPSETEVVLFHVFSRIPETYWDFDQHPESDVWMKKLKAQEEAHEKEVKNFMNKALQRLLKADFREQLVSVEIHNRVTGIARDIIHEAKKNFHAVIMGRTGTGKLSGLAVGSVTSKVLPALPKLHMCVVTGKPQDGNILVAIDGSEGSMRAVDYLCSLKGANHHEIILFHAMRHIGFTKTQPLKEVEKLVWGDAKKAIEPVMTEAKKRLVDSGIAKSKIKTKIVTGVDSRAGALIEEAKQSTCSTIMVGRSGVSQVEEFNIGRVSNKVIHQAKNTAVWVIA
jgi:nucleotide-binding universal stress UspA family protein